MAMRASAELLNLPADRFQTFKTSVVILIKKPTRITMMTVATIISIRVNPLLRAFDFPVRIILILT
jgi:hypothetical protein